MRQSSRRSDDADVIRARLRALLDDGSRGGWVPEDDDAGPATGPGGQHEPGYEPGYEADGASVDRPSGTGRHRLPGPTARWDPGRVGARSLWTAGLLAALLLVGWTWLDRPRIEPVPPAPPDSASTGAPNTASTTGATTAGTGAPTASPAVGEAAGTATPVVVAVVGLVARPGLVTVPTGSRVADAIEAAGGLLPGTDPAAVNLAAVLADGQQIAVGVPGAVAGPPTAAGGAGGPVNLNTATAEDLDALPGIGPVLAQRIVAHRGAEGPFRSVDQLDDVPGIGPTTAAELAELVRV